MPLIKKPVFKLDYDPDKYTEIMSREHQGALDLSIICFHISIILFDVLLIRIRGSEDGSPNLMKAMRYICRAMVKQVKPHLLGN